MASFSPPPWQTFLETYFDAYFKARDVVTTLQLLASDATGFGTGPEEVGRRGQELRDLYLKDLAQMRQPIRYHFSWIEGRMLGDRHALAFGLITLEVDTPEGPLTFPDLRLTTILAFQEDGWRMLHHHLSEPTRPPDDRESFSLKELRWFNTVLQEEVQRRTEELEARNQALEKALAEVRTLKGLLPICAACKRIRDDQGYWREVEAYLSTRTDATFTHGLCPSCMKNYFPENR